MPTKKITSTSNGAEAPPAAAPSTTIKRVAKAIAKLGTAALNGTKAPRRAKAKAAAADAPASAQQAPSAPATFVPATPASPAATSIPAPLSAAKPPAGRATRPAPAAKPAPVTPPSLKARRPAPPKPAPEPSYTHDDVALRAYLISERRQMEGREGNPDEDWAEAERQLVAESSKARRRNSKVR